LLVLVAYFSVALVAFISRATDGGSPWLEVDQAGAGDVALVVGLVEKHVLAIARLWVGRRKQPGEGRGLRAVGT
jgi:hypothetical protein